MSWNGPDINTIRVTSRPDGCSPTGITSMSVVRIDEEASTEDWSWPEDIFQWPDGLGDVPGNGTVRMYGIESSHFAGENRAFTYSDSRGCSAFTPEQIAEFEPLSEIDALDELCDGDPHEYRAVDQKDGRMQYIDTEDPFDPTFWARPAGQRAGAALLGSTCIPKFRVFDSYYYYALDYTTLRWFGTGLELRMESAVVYQDSPEVVQLPDGRWVMFLQQFVSLLSDAGTGWDGFGFTDFKTRSNKDCSFCNIVCYVADDPSFQTGLQGPFRVVDGRDALPDDEAGPEVNGWKVKPRLYVGVPGAVVKGQYIYVYYTIDSAYDFDDRRGPPGEEPPKGKLPDENEPEPDGSTECYFDTVGGDLTGGLAQGRDAYEEILDRLDFTPGFAVKRIDVVEFATFLRTARISAEQDTWDAWRSIGFNLDVPGELLGRVTIWMRSPEFSSLYVNAEVGLCAGSGALGDPSPARCPDTDRLLLFLAFARCPDGDAGGGLWRAVQLEDTIQTEDSLEHVPEEGVDFVIEATSEDSLIARNVPMPPEDSGLYWPSGQYLNPDPIRLADGTWRVYSGGGLNDVFEVPEGEEGSSAPTALNVFTGTDEEGGCG